MADRNTLVAKLKGKRPQHVTHDIVLDGDALGALAVARATHERQLRVRPDDVAETAAALEAAETAAEDAVATLHFQALPRAAYEALQLMHEPTDEQRAAKPPQTYNLDTFLPALLAATIVEPDVQAPALTAEQVRECPADRPLPGRLLSLDETEELIAEWNQGEVGQVWMTALSVCEQARNPTLPFGSGRTRG